MIYDEGKIHTVNYPKRVTIFTKNFWKLVPIRNPQWLNSRPEKYERVYP